MIKTSKAFYRSMAPLEFLDNYVRQQKMQHYTYYHMYTRNDVINCRVSQSQLVNMQTVLQLTNELFLLSNKMIVIPF